RDGGGVYDIGRPSRPKEPVPEARLGEEETFEGSPLGEDLTSWAVAVTTVHFWREAVRVSREGGGLEDLLAFAAEAIGLNPGRVWDSQPGEVVEYAVGEDPGQVLRALQTRPS
ncbi:hypothetical protein L6232_22040, partial [Shewanella sp. C31]|nr:hypothetical protein [Shewanella electrica]